MNYKVGFHRKEAGFLIKIVCVPVPIACVFGGGYAGLVAALVAFVLVSNKLIELAERVDHG
ncbi:MAG: hypothetical protein R8M46_01745 [Ghiorsea sp.]